MGVKQGLESYVRDRGLGRIVVAARDGPCLPALVLDGNAVLFHLAHKSGADARFDGDFRVFERYSLPWLQCLCAVAPAGVHVFFDGLPDPAKAAETAQRNRDRVAAVQRACHAIARDPHALLPPSEARLLPARFLGAVFREMLTLNGVPWEICETEADGAIAAYAVARGALVVSRDTDFHIFAVPGYVPLPDLAVDTVTGQVTLRLFDPGVLPATLRLPPPLLPLWACVLGTDQVPADACAAYREGVAGVRARGAALLEGTARALADLAPGPVDVQAAVVAVAAHVAGPNLAARAHLSAMLTNGMAAYDIAAWDGSSPLALSCHALGRVPSLLHSVQLRRVVAWPVNLEDARSGRPSVWNGLLKPLRRHVLRPFAPVRESMRVGPNYVSLPADEDEAEAEEDEAAEDVACALLSVPDLVESFGESCVLALRALPAVPRKLVQMATLLVLCDAYCGGRDACVCHPASPLLAAARAPAVTMAGVNLVSTWLGVVTLVSMRWAGADARRPAPVLRVLGDGRVCHHLLERLADRPASPRLPCPSLQNCADAGALPPRLWPLLSVFAQDALSALKPAAARARVKEKNALGSFGVEGAD